MSWLNGSPKRQASKPKNISGLNSKGSWLSSTKRTYGSSRQILRDQVGAVAVGSYGSRRNAVLSSMNDEDIESPLAASSTQRLSSGMDSSPTELAFSTDKCCDLDLGSPVGDSPPASPRERGTLEGKARRNNAKKTPARVRKGTGTIRVQTAGGSRKTTLSRDSSIDPTDPINVYDEAVPRQKSSAGVRKPRGARARGSAAPKVLGEVGDEFAVNSESGSTQRSPIARRDRSPTRRAAGRPSTRKPSPPLQIPLRPIAITNNTSDGERSQRGNSKVVDGRAKLAVERLSRDSSSDSSSGEEEWQDEGMDFTTKRASWASAEPRPNFEKQGRRRAMERSRTAPTRGTRNASTSSDGEKRVTTCDSEERFGDSDSGSDYAGENWTSEDEVDERRPDKETEQVSKPPPLITSGVPVSLDSSVEGILVGDKRRRGGKRGARAAEENAHRSSRCRHLSPNLPISTGSEDHHFSVKEEGDVDLDSAIDVDENSRGASPCSSHPGKHNKIALLPGSTSSAFTTAQTSLGQSARSRRTVSEAGLRTSATSPALSMTTLSSSELVEERRQQKRSSVAVALPEAVGRDSDNGEHDLAGLPMSDDSPGPRLSRSLSSSVVPAFGGVSSGCAKVTGSSFRRRSRVSSTSSPLPMLEISKSLPTVGLAGSGAAAAGDLNSRSMGLRGALRAENRKRRSSTSEVLATRTKSPLVRSHRMSLGGGLAGGRTGERITSPQFRGLLLGEIQGVKEELSRESEMGDDPGVNWVLRAPGAPVGHYRSMSLASGIKGISLPRFASAPTPSQNIAMALDTSSEPLRRFSGAAWEMSAVEGGVEDSSAGPTPQTSPSSGAASHRSRGLSSVARRMNRLEIGSPDVEMHAAEAQKAILSSPFRAEGDHTSSVASAGSPVRPYPEPSALQIQLTPVGYRSRLSGAGASPTECLRDYLSGQQQGRGGGKYVRPIQQQQQEGTRSPESPLAPRGSMPSYPVTTASPPGTTFTRSAALGLTSSLGAGLFVGDAGGRGEAVERNPVGDAAMRGAAEFSGEGGAYPALSRGDLPWPRKGKKLARERRSRTVPMTVGDGAVSVAARMRRESLEGGFLIRRKSVGHSALPSTSTRWSSACAEDEAENDTLSMPPALARVSSGSGSSSKYLSCLSSGTDVEFGERSPLRSGGSSSVSRHRGMSSPSALPLARPSFDTPSALVISGKPEASGMSGISGGKSGKTDGMSSEAGSTDLSANTFGVPGALPDATDPPTSESKCAQICLAFGGPGAPAPPLPDCNSRRTSAESVGAPISSHGQFETPQAENKCKWGSRPQYGDWGISQPASASSLKRFMAFAGKALGERSGSGCGDMEWDFQGTDLRPASPGAQALGTPLRSTTPLEDDDVQTRPSRGTPGSTSSARGSGGPSFYRHSLDTLSERGERGESGVKSDGEEVKEKMEVENAPEKIPEGSGIPGGGVGDAGEVWSAVVAGDLAESVKARDGTFGERPGRSRLSSLLMTDAQREEQRRRQSKAKRRRVSLSIKKFRHSSLGVTSHLAGLSLLDQADATSPGANKAGKRHPQPYPTSCGGNAGFAGGAIAEGEEEEEERDEEPMVMSRPRSAATSTAAQSRVPSCLRSIPTSKEKGLSVKVAVTAKGASTNNYNYEEGVRGVTPEKVREDLEKSLTDLTNLSLSMCNSEEDALHSSRPRGHLGPLQDNASPQEKTGTDFVLYYSDAAKGVLGSSVGRSVLVGNSRKGAGAPTPCSVQCLEALRRQGLIAKVLCMLSADDLVGETPLVCTTWRKAAILAYSEVASDMTVVQDSVAVGGAGASRGASAASGGGAGGCDVWTRQKLLNVFPWGSFLSEGACKQVYRVWNAAQRRVEALSVMDREEIMGDEEVVSQEVRVSILASSLVQRGICPNFVQTFGLFRSDSPPCSEVFGTAKQKYPCGRSPGIIRTQPRMYIPSRGMDSQGLLAHGGGSKPPPGNNLRYQYIGMELCEHGDAEMFIKAQHDCLLPLQEAQGFLFQMAFSLYAGRVELSLRHFDVKLLNFFVGNLCQTAVGDESDGGLIMSYGLGRDVMELYLPRDRAYVVKLADFGTADVNPMTIGAPVGEGHFTTLENTPMDQLCCGSEARQGYASDTFALALAAVHLFTGEAPYEEIMEEVECPDDLYDALATTWNNHPQYADLCQIVLDAETSEEEENSSDAEEGEDVDVDQDSTLMNTFYRYLVLFGVPERVTLDEAFGRDNPVWKAVGALLGWKASKGRGGAGGGRGRRAPGSSAASKRFCRQLEKDQALFSLARGRNPYIKRARSRLDAIPGATELVLSMASFGPGSRPTMLEVMRSEAFSSLRGSEIGERRGAGRCLEFMKFACGKEGGNPPLNL